MSLILSLSLAWETSQGDILSTSRRSYKVFIILLLTWLVSVTASVPAFRHLNIPHHYIVFTIIYCLFLFSYDFVPSPLKAISMGPAYFVFRNTVDFYEICSIYFLSLSLFLPLSVSDLLFLSPSISFSLLLFPLHHFRTLHHEAFNITWWGLWPGNTVFHICQHTRRVHYPDKRKTRKFIAKMIWRCLLSLEWIPTDPGIRVCVWEKEKESACF